MVYFFKKKKLLTLGACSFILISVTGVNIYTKPDNKNIPNNIVANTEFIANTCQVSEDIIKKHSDIISEKADTEKEKQEDFAYMEEIKMPKKHQEYLYKMCKERGLDYLKILAIIKNESEFNSEMISKSNDYGYMQINKVNHKYLSEILKTENRPLDPYVNINWGTYMLSELYKQWKAKGISSKTEGDEVFSELDKYVMSSYNKGVNGFKKHGMANRYISITRGAYKNLKEFDNKNPLTCDLSRR